MKPVLTRPLTTVLCFAVAICSTGVNAPALAGGIKLKSAEMTSRAYATQAGKRPGRLALRRGTAGDASDDVWEPEDYAADCNAHGGGASSENDTWFCTDPEGNRIIVPLPD